jgi:hypothetical protein
VEPIPDHDWVGETWGLYFSDYEEELLKILEQEPEKYIRDRVHIRNIIRELKHSNSEQCCRIDI